MNRFKQLVLAGVLVGAGAWIATAQTNLTTTSVNRDGQYVSPEKLTVNDASTTSNLRPPRTERDQLPPEVRARIERFKLDARAYLNRQEQLKKKLQGANDQERAVIREKLKQLREQWLEQARELRKEFRSRQLELIDKLPDYREVIDSVRNAALDQSKQAQEETRTRRGED